MGPAVVPPSAVRWQSRSVVDQSNGRASEGCQVKTFFNTLLVIVCNILYDNVL
jgi:hypothetical protein